jgi:hypothetical protein
MEFCFKISKKVCLTSRYNFLSKITCLPRNAGRLEVTLMQHFVSSRYNFKGFERNPLKSYRELDLTHLTSRYISLVFSKQTKHSKWHLSFCQFEWFHWIRKKSHEIVSRTRLNSFYFSIHFACFFKTNKTLEVTGMNHFVSSSDFMGFERNLMKSYRELDLTHLTSRYILLVFSKQTKHSKWQVWITLSVRVISRDSKEIPWNRIENSTNDPRLTTHG